MSNITHLSAYSDSLAICTDAGDVWLASPVGGLWYPDKNLVTKVSYIYNSGTHRIIVLDDGTQVIAVAESATLWTFAPIPLGSASTGWLWAYGPETWNENNGAPEDGFRTPQRPNHNGIDMGYGAANVLGNPLGIMAAGVTIEWRPHWSYGNRMCVDHGDYISTYNHMFEPAYVDVGVQMDQGQVIGGLGSTGDSTGVHHHFEIFSKEIDDYVNPHVIMAIMNPNNEVVQY